MLVYVDARGVYVYSSAFDLVTYIINITDKQHEHDKKEHFFVACILKTHVKSTLNTKVSSISQKNSQSSKQMTGHTLSQNKQVATSKHIVTEAQSYAQKYFQVCIQAFTSVHKRNVWRYQLFHYVGPPPALLPTPSTLVDLPSPLSARWRATEGLPIIPTIPIVSKTVFHFFQHIQIPIFLQYSYILVLNFLLSCHLLYTLSLSFSLSQHYLQKYTHTLNTLTRIARTILP